MTTKARPRKPPIRTPPLEKLAAARVIGYLRDARESLGRASVVLAANAAGDLARALDAIASGIEHHTEDIERLGL